MALRPKAESTAVQSAQEQVAAATAAIYWSWLDRVRQALRNACHGDENLRRRASYRIQAKAEVRGGELSAEAIDALFKRRQAVRDHLADRLGKASNESWDFFFDRISTRRALPYSAEVLLELGGISAPAPGVRPMTRRPIDDEQRLAQADETAAAWVGSP